MGLGLSLNVFLQMLKYFGSLTEELQFIISFDRHCHQSIQ